MYDITALGELLIDFTQVGLSENDMRLFEQNPGGAVSNVLCAVARLGLKTAFIGKVGNDIHGNFLSQVLKDADVDIKGLVKARDVFTTLAFVELSEDGERTFSFARNPGADTCLDKHEINESLIKNTRIFHVGSLSLTNEPARSATYHAINVAKEAGAIISYDPNYRAPLWDNEQVAKELMRSIIQLTDVVKLSLEEMEFLTGTDEMEKGMNALADKGVKCIVVTMGENGAAVHVENQTEIVAIFPCRVVDTTGAGDAFWGGFLYSMLNERKLLSELDIDDAVRYARFASATASLCIEKRGGIPAMPALDSVMKLLAQNKS